MPNLKKITMYVTTEEFAAIKQDATAGGATVSCYMRALIDQYSPVKLPPLAKQGALVGNTNGRGRPRKVSVSDESRFSHRLK